MLRGLRDLVLGREPAAKPVPTPTAPEIHPFGPPPGPPLPKPEPIPADYPWAGPPPIKTGHVIRSIYDTGLKHQRFDISLLEDLNAEYASKPVAPQPRSYSSDAMFESARRRVRWAHNHVDLRNQKVLEIGCGNGVEAWTMANSLGADVYGIDVMYLGSWDTLAGDRCQFLCADLTQNNPFPENTFDRIVSYTVWEHVMHPHALLEQTYRILKPGGLHWLRANLYAGPKASHRYREIFFPWPHLLFTDEVVRDWDIEHGRPPKGLSWVNRLTLHHYRAYFADVGFKLRRLDIQRADFDEDFYRRFEDTLGRFPRTDLREDFFLAVLEKPA
jgi:ubiquinone/menaquinone biosynthesis C-methylase UbiE